MKTRVSLLLVATFVVAGCGDSASPTAPQSPVNQTPTAATLASVTVASSSVEGGSATQGTVALTAAAPAGGFAVALSSSAAAVTVPASVSVAAGATGATFAIATTAVSSATNVTITAAANGVSRTVTLRVTADAPLVGLTSVHDDVIGGDDTTGTIVLAAPAPSGGTRVALTSDHPSVDVPDQLTIPAGARSASFTIETYAVTEPVDATITATFDGPAQAAGATTLTLRIKVVPTPNNAPVAVADSYTTDEDTTLTVDGASGVLANDTDTDNDTLTVDLVSGPSKGSLTLNEDGSFEYVPNADYAGTDSFTYRVTDGTLTSAPATVTIAIEQLFDEEAVFVYNGTDGSDGSPQEWEIPEGVTRIRIEAYGAEGGPFIAGAFNEYVVQGGLGAGVQTEPIDVTPETTLAVYVGGVGGNGRTFAGTAISGGAGGYHGGGAGGGGAGLTGGGGGGASEVRYSGVSLVVAGGGGGAAHTIGTGGAGGESGLAGGGPCAGNGATPDTPGAGGNCPLVAAGGDGAPMMGGVGVDSDPGGGGGGGVYGGGGGSHKSGGGGGSGMSIVAATFTTGANSGHGKVIIRW